MRTFKQGAALALATMAALTGSLATSGPAMAASSPIAACGGGSYHVIDQHSLGPSSTIYLLYNGSTNCVVTWRKRKDNTMLTAKIRREGGIYVSDSGRFSTYAGPVKISAQGKCIQWGGNDYIAAYTSPPEHCG
ncbi:spore-associated protein A [Nonomuraea sp. NPDC000554]|uniref:spore-associated protein A n=1 Tax=Nonomuraea sp. NPDC000554 TaxID=3154259 RepID=UPI00332E62E0